MTGLFLLVALAAVAAAIVFFAQGRQAAALAASRDAEVTRLRAEADKARADETQARSEAKERREVAKKLEADLAAAKRRAFEQAEASKKSGGAAVLRDEIEKLGHRLAESREEATRSSERVRAAEAALAKVQAELASERDARRALQAAPPPAPVVSAPPVAAAADDGKVAALEAQVAAERDRAEKAETRSAELRKKLSEVEKELRAARGRVETERRVYMVQKGELELANDRYAELRRRYDGLKKDHQDLIEAVRQAAREEARLSAPAAQPEPPQAGQEEKPVA